MEMIFGGTKVSNRKDNITINLNDVFEHCRRCKLDFYIRIECELIDKPTYHYGLSELCCGFRYEYEAHTLERALDDIMLIIDTQCDGYEVRVT